MGNNENSDLTENKKKQLESLQDPKVTDPIASPSEINTLQHTREIQALHDATKVLLSTLDLETLLGKILDAAISAIPAADKGMIHLIAHESGKLEMRALLGYTEKDPRIHRQSLPDPSENVGQVVYTQAPLLLDHSLDKKDSQSAIIAPLVMEGKSLGALSLEATTKSAFNEDDLSLLVSFAATATAAIRNAQLHAEVQRLAITDPLTGVYNRRGIFELGEREVARALRFGRPLSALMLDIDHLKPINDSFGHSAGDKLLIFVAQQCQKCLRNIDILSRYGGDEFAILLPESDLFAANIVADRLHENISDVPVQIDEGTIQISISIGISKVTPEISNLTDLLKKTDDALYMAKQAGRKQTIVK